MNAHGSRWKNLTHTPDIEEEGPAWLPDARRLGVAAFQVECDRLGPGPEQKGLGMGLLPGLIANLPTVTAPGVAPICAC